MKRVRKLLLWVILPLLVILIITAVVLVKMAGSFLTREAVVERIEAEKNCRVMLGSVDASLFGGKVVLRDLVMVPRDAHADSGTALDDRPAPEPSQTAIRVKHAELNASFGDLLKKKLTVDSLVIEGLDVSFLVERDDSISLDPLFDPPMTVKGEPNQDYQIKKERRDLAKERRKLEPDDPKAVELANKIKGFNIDELPLPATMNKLQIKDGVVNMKIRRDKTRIRLYDLQGELGNLDIDASDLVNHNSARLDLNCRLDVTGRDKVTVYADLDLHAEGNIVPFDSDTGFLNPDIVTAVTVRKDSKIFSLPLIEKLTKVLDVLKKAGLDVSDLEDTLIVREDATVPLGWRDTVLRTAGQVSINLNGHELELDEGSWLHTGSNDHEITAELTFSQQISDSTFGRANEELGRLANLVDPETLTQIADMLFKPVTKDGRLYVPFLSTGDFGKPKVRPRVELMNMSDLLKDQAKDGAIKLLDDLIKDR